MLYYVGTALLVGNFFKMNISTTVVSQKVEDFIDTIPEPDRCKVVTEMEKMGTDIEMVHVKTLKSPIKELIVKKYRILFFIKDNIIYFTNGFIKKTQKTPKLEIDQAERLYKLIK